MSLVSNLFILFVAASVLIYYLVPRRFQWIVLLAFSYIYYIAGGPRYVVFILFSTIVTWLLALLIEKTEGNGNHKGAERLREKNRRAQGRGQKLLRRGRTRGTLRRCFGKAPGRAV